MASETPLDLDLEIGEREEVGKVVLRWRVPKGYVYRGRSDRSSSVFVPSQNEVPIGEHSGWRKVDEGLHAMRVGNIGHIFFANGCLTFVPADPIALV